VTGSNRRPPACKACEAFSPAPVAQTSTGGTRSRCVVTGSDGIDRDAGEGPQQPRSASGDHRQARREQRQLLRLSAGHDVGHCVTRVMTVTRQGSPGGRQNLGGRCTGRNTNRENTRTSRRPDAHATPPLRRAAHGTQVADAVGICSTESERLAVSDSWRATSQSSRIDGRSDSVSLGGGCFRSRRRAAPAASLPA